MQSTTRISIPADLLSEITAVHLGVPTVCASELTDGWFNTIYRLDLADDRSVVIKVAPPPDHRVMRYERDLLTAEVGVLRLLGGTDGVPVPAVLAHDASGRLLAHDYFIMDLVPGAVYSKVRGQLQSDERAAIDAELGRISAAINGVSGARFGRYHDDACVAPSWSRSFPAMVDDLLADAADQSTALPVSAQAVRDACLRAQADLDAVGEPRLVVWDLHHGNVFVDGTRVCGIIDCDRALWGDPLMEFFFRSLAWTSDDFYQGYRACADLPDDTPARRRRWLYDLYLGLVMVIECDFRGFTSDHRAWACSRLGEVVASAEPGWFDGG